MVETLDVQDACWRLSYLVLSGIEFNLQYHNMNWHYQSLTTRYDEESCDDYRQAYHLSSSSVEEIFKRLEIESCEKLRSNSNTPTTGGLRGRE